MPKTKSLLIACAVFVLAMAPLPSAFAQSERQHHQDQRGQSRGNSNEQHNDIQREPREHRDQNPAPAPPMQPRQDMRVSHADPRGCGAGPDHNVYLGNRLPLVYRQRTGVVNDWRGHRWVQTGSDYLLVAIATGVLRDLTLSN